MIPHCLLLILLFVPLAGGATALSTSRRGSCALSAVILFLLAGLLLAWLLGSSEARPQF